MFFWIAQLHFCFISTTSGYETIKNSVSVGVLSKNIDSLVDHLSFRKIEGFSVKHWESHRSEGRKCEY